MTNHYQHRIGDDATLTVPIKDGDGAAVNCTTGTITVEARSYVGNTSTIFTEASTGVTVTGASTGVTIAFTDAALSGVNPGQYIFNVIRVLSSTTTSYPPDGAFTLLLLA